jgi:hypothetical protein
MLLQINGDIKSKYIAREELAAGPTGRKNNVLQNLTTAYFFCFFWEVLGIINISKWKKVPKSLSLSLES